MTQPEKDALTVIQQTVVLSVNDSDRDNVQALIIEELRRLHEGVLARYGLRQSQAKGAHGVSPSSRFKN